MFLSNRARLLRFLQARGAGEAAEDILQELWLKIERYEATLVSEPLSYLYRAADNLFLDQRRSELRRRRREREWSEGDDEEASSIESGERLLAARQEVRAAEAALAGLGERTEAIFRRFRLENRTQREIALEMGISLSAVEKHLQKAYRTLLDLRRRDDED